MKHLSRVFSYLLLLAAMTMLAWGSLGLLEYLFGIAPLMPLQNPTFPPGTQLIHWVLIIASGVIFLGGYFLRWRHTPLAMIVVYAMLATLCAVETFDFMENPGRYTSWVVECINYVLVSLYLTRSQRMRAHFGLEDAKP